jgi:hypothetical protein
MQSLHKWLRFSLLVAALGLTMGQSKCPDYGNPGNSGPLPPNTPPTAHKYQEKTPANPPDPLTCDRPVYQTITVSETNVTCEPTFNYATLFTQAKALADGIAAATQCPANCRPVHSWIERLTTECLGNTAGVVLEIGLLCPRAGTAKPPGVPMTAANPALNGPPMQLPNPQPPAKPSIGDVTGKVAATAVTCTPVELVEYRYREPAACGGAGFNYKPFVTRAERRAPAVCGAVTCAAGCAPCVPPVITRSQWGCRNGNEVDITVHVQCCK